MQLHKISLLTLMGLLLVTDTAMAAGGAGVRARTRSEEDLAAILAESERTAAAEEAARTRRSDEELRAAMEASKISAIKVRAKSPSLRAAVYESKVSAAEEAKGRAQRDALSTRKDARIAVAAESTHSIENWSNPSYIRTHLDTLIKDNAAYKAIVSTNLSLDEKTAKEGEFGRGGGKLEDGYRRKKLERVIAKLEGTA